MVVAAVAAVAASSSCVRGSEATPRSYRCALPRLQEAWPLPESLSGQERLLACQAAVVGVSLVLCSVLLCSNFVGIISSQCFVPG